MADRQNRTKLREQYTRDIIDEVVSFANSDGGVVYIGIREDSAVLGVANPEETAARAAEDILVSVQPDISPILQVRTVQLGGKDVVAVMVGKGISKPYSRVDSDDSSDSDEPHTDSDVQPQPEWEDAPSAPESAPNEVAADHKPSSESSVPEKAVIRPAAKPIFGFSENAPCTEQLTFTTLANVMETCEIPTDDETLRSLGIMSGNSFTGLALLLSEQCPYTIKITQYDGCSKSAILSSAVISGSLLRQLAESCRLVERLAPHSFPADAMSEVLLNALVHRDYSFSGSTLVNIFSDRLEVISLGGLPEGVSMAAVELGISLPRYPKLAGALCRMELMECCGSGIDRVRGLYAGLGREIRLESVDGAFRVVLPDVQSSARKTAPDGYNALVLRLAEDKGFVVRSDVEQLTGLKTTAAYNLLKELVSEGLLVAGGVGKKTIYKLP